MRLGLRLTIQLSAIFLFSTAPAAADGPSMAAVEEVIFTAKGDVTRCYEEEMRRKSPLEGELVLEFTITGEGTVDDVQPRVSTLASEELVECITSTFGALQFPAPGEPVVVVYPLRFEDGWACGQWMVDYRIAQGDRKLEGRKLDNPLRNVRRRDAYGYYNHACRCGNALGCRKLGDLETSVSDRISSETAEHYRLACVGGDATGCASLAFLYEQGLGVDADPQTARTYDVLACSLGDAVACLKLQLLEDSLIRPYRSADPSPPPP